MKVLAIDPGAKRCGWAVCEGREHANEIKYVASGILGQEQTLTYQEHRLGLIRYWLSSAHNLLYAYSPDLVVSEIVPPTGGTIGNIVNRQLALTVITTVQTMAFIEMKPVQQLGATTVKKRVAQTGKATKPKVRDGVLRHLPELEPRRPEWTGKNAVWDEVDALAVAIAYLRN